MIVGVFEVHCRLYVSDLERFALHALIVLKSKKIAHVRRSNPDYLGSTKTARIVNLEK